MFCNKCGTNLPEGSAFCPGCGNKIAVAPVAPVEPVAPAAPVEPVVPVAPVAPVEPVAPVAPVAPVEPVAPVYAEPAAPVYAEPAAPVYAEYATPVYAAPAAPAAPQKKNMAWLYVLIGVLVVAIAAAVLYFTGAFDDLFGGNDDDDDDKGGKPGTSQSDTASNSLVGTWTYDDETLTLNEDGTGILDETSITWEVRDDNTLCLTAEDGYEVVLTFVVNGNTATFTSEDGDQSVWSKSAATTNSPIGGILGGDSLIGGNATTTTRGNATQVPTYTQAPTYTEAPPLVEPTETQAQPTGSAGTQNPSAGYITDDGYGNDVYYNKWANLMFGLDDGWVEGTAAEYSAMENQTTACGMYLKKTTNGVNSHVLTLTFEMLTGSNTSITLQEYMTNVCQGMISAYSASGVTYEVGDLKTIHMAGETWSDFTVSLNDGAVYQRCVARRQGDCVILISVTALSESELSSVLYGFTTID